MNNQETTIFIDSRSTSPAITKFENAMIIAQLARYEMATNTAPFDDVLRVCEQKLRNGEYVNFVLKRKIFGKEEIWNFNELHFPLD